MMEAQADEFIKNNEWNKALDIYTQLLQMPENEEREIIGYLLNRCRCLHELGNHEAIVGDCEKFFKNTNIKGDSSNILRIRIWLIRSYLILNRYTEAETVVKEWLMVVKQLNELGESKKLLENMLERFFSLTNRQNLEIWLNSLEMKFSRNSPTSNCKKMQDIICIYCNIAFKDKAELAAHCLTEEHETMIMSDEGHDWQWRAPPRGLKSDSYRVCDNWRETGNCKYGVQCVEAHGVAELMEWKERFQYREMKLLKARQKELYGKSYTEGLLEKWVQTANPSHVMRDKIDSVDDLCSCPLTATVTSKTSNHQWIFILKTKQVLKAVALLQDTHRNHFFLTKIEIGSQTVETNNSQEWINFTNLNEHPCPIQYNITVRFETTIFGTFRQSVVFDFGSEPVLVKHLCVDVVPDSDFEKINEIRKEITVSIAERWTNLNSEIIHFNINSTIEGNDDWEKNLKLMYPCPDLRSFVLSNATVAEKKFTRNNYKERMHELLVIEEIERYSLIAQFNLRTKLQIAHSYLLSPNNMAASTAKYSSSGELFASICLGRELSEDTSEGRLILMHCNAVYLRPNSPKMQNPRKTYEALIEDKGKNMIYLRLSATMVHDLQLTTDTDLEVQIQFQLNRIPYCEWHYILDKMQNFKLIFPDTFLEPRIPWSPSRQWSSALDQRLNLKQKEAVLAIVTPTHVQIPPILVIGPFGTGKTFTLAQGVKELIKDERNRILLCTHSNSAADLYIKDYLDPWVTAGVESARPLRIYYQKRWVSTVSPVVQKYCCIQQKGGMREFYIPTKEEISKHRIIVVTLSTSIYLSRMSLPPGFFTHILLDEAAQALECETITPLALANETTRIVLAGDHMQLGPDIFSKFARDRNLHISLLERLYDHYPNQFPCKILLCENYRAHETIIQFTSESFYDQKLVSSSRQPKHFKFYPLTFFTTRGEDVQDKNSTAFYNNSEVYEVVERVMELKQNWPNEWGEMNEQSIGVVAPYSDQVFRIRSELRKRKTDVCVERVLNVQGKQFRVIILSTVRTRKTCANKKGANEADYGFLSNSKLLNTAITRAQSLVAVVGDPVALCSVGRCSKVWERFIQICNDHNSLFGITWTQLKLQLDGIELKKIYTLNPLAPEFIPRKYKEMMQENYSRAPPTFTPIIQPNIIPPFSAIQNDLIRIPLMYQPQQLQRFVYGIPPPSSNAQPLPLANGYRPFAPGEVPLVVPQRQILAPPNNLHLTPAPIPNFHPKVPINSNAKLIQFMNNVHFPEAQILSDCVSLLPQQMSLAEMLMQPPNVQERWYNYLRETSGFEVAEKFKYLLHTTNQKGSRISEPNIFERTTPLSSSSGSPTYNWYDSPSNQINFNKPIYMTEIENGPSTGGLEVHKSNPLYKRQTRQANNAITQQKHVINNAIKVNGFSENSQSQLHKRVNEDFANLNLNLNVNGSPDDWYEAFKAFSSENQATGTTMNGTVRAESCSSNDVRLYKHFS